MKGMKLAKVQTSIFFPPQKFSAYMLKPGQLRQRSVKNLEILVEGKREQGGRSKWCKKLKVSHPGLYTKILSLRKAANLEKAKLKKNQWIGSSLP